MTFARAVRRTAAATALLLPLALAAPTAQAAVPTAVQSAAVQSAAVRPVDPVSVVDHVSEFYGAYIRAVHTHDTAQELRQRYLTADLRKRLAVWEARNHADGVLRAQDTPHSWRVSHKGSRTGHSSTKVRLTWGSKSRPTYSYLNVRTTPDGKISDISDGAARR